MAASRAEQEIPLLIQGLIGELPPRDQRFPKAARERWLAALAVNLDLLYGSTDDEESASRAFTTRDEELRQAAEALAAGNYAACVFDDAGQPVQEEHR